jgi:uridine monophosphate synthetase
MTSSFVDKLRGAIERNGSLLCVGLDPDLNRVQDDRSGSDRERLVRWSLALVEQTADLVCCYKPNFAFYEQYGPQGLDALRQVIDAVPDDVPVLLDAKRGDIGNTAAAYARAAFETWGADAVTVSPYLGRDSVAPFLAYEGKAVFVLCQTSNPSAAEIQSAGNEPLYHRVARLGQTWGDAGRVGFVVGATRPESLAEVRALAPDRWLLAPGIGAQGGDLAAALAGGLTADGSGVIVPVSRAVIYADDPRAAAGRLRDEIDRHRRERRAAGAPVQGGARGLADLVLALYEAGCVRFGDFTLASGKRTPIYIDLRRVISYPAAFKRVVDAYTALVRPLQFDRLAAVPYSGLPIGAGIVMQTDYSLIYPRKEVKAHGTGQAVEGAFEAGHTALVIEDVVTSGRSLIKAIAKLEEAGLVVRDAIALVDREQGGGAALAQRGCRLHAVLTLRQMLDVLHARGCISPETHREVETYLSNNGAN